MMNSEIHDKRGINDKIAHNNIFFLTIGILQKSTWKKSENVNTYATMISIDDKVPNTENINTLNFISSINLVDSHIKIIEMMIIVIFSIKIFDNPKTFWYIETNL